MLPDLERRYELEGTTIDLHGDGAAWITQGLEWLPHSVYVLNRCHKNKTLKELVRGLEGRTGRHYERQVRKALEAGGRPTGIEGLARADGSPVSGEAGVDN